METEMQERIEKLKDPNAARQAGWLKKYDPEAYHILEVAGQVNRLRLNREEVWVEDYGDIAFVDCLILKPGYEPEPEHEEWQIRKNSEGHLSAFNKAGGSERTLARCAHQPNFVCFHFLNGSVTRIPGDVPNWLRDQNGQTMYARFVRKNND